MKKITLFVAVVLSASTTFAVPRFSTFMTPMQKVNGGKVTKRLVPATTLRVAEPTMAGSRAEGDETPAVTTELHYMDTEQALYSGMSPDYSSWTGFALAGIRGQLTYLNSTIGPDEFSWGWEDFDYEKEEFVAQPVTNTFNFTRDVLPLQMSTVPTLTATIGGSETTYTSKEVVAVFGGATLNHYGFNTDPDQGTYADSELPIEFTLGVNPTPAPLGKDATTIFYETMIDHSETSESEESEKLFNEYGMCKDLVAAYEAERFTNVKPLGFAMYVPKQNSPYQLKHVWMNVQGHNKEAVTLPVYVYGRDADGYWNLEKPLGAGSINLPKGEYYSAVLGTAPIASIYATDDQGYETDVPALVNSDIFVCVQGLDNENIIDFAPIMYASTTIPVDYVNLDLIDYYRPSHTAWFVNTDYVDKDDPTNIQNMNTFLTIPVAYYADEARTSVVCPSDVMMYMNVEFPIIVDLETETANFDAELPITGGSKTFYVLTAIDFQQYCTDGLITSATEQPWLNYEVGFDEENQVATITVSADALPEGVTGREGTIEFTGYAYDFTVNVLQGESGISAVVANGSGASQYFDLQGRRLTSAPAKGFYIERNGTHATTKLAR